MRDINEIRLEAERQIKKANIGIDISDVSIKLESVKSTRFWGMTRAIKDNYTIALNTVLLENEPGDYDFAVCTMIHELLHVMALRVGQTGHGGIWAQLANLVRRSTKYDVRVGNKYRELRSQIVAESRYVVGCPKCDAIWPRSRASRLTREPENYKCAYCDSKLYRIK